MKFHILFQYLKNILSHLKRKKPSQSCSDTPRSLKRGELVGICVGHSRPGDKGAVNYDGTVDEWSYNLEAGEALKKALKDKGVRSILYSAYEGKTYRTAMTYIRKKLKLDGATAAVELHFNASGVPTVRGCETWYRYGSTEGRKLAQHIQTSIIAAYGNRNRGVKAAKAPDRGFSFMKNDALPAVLCEPFFGDDKKDYILFSKPTKLGQHLADGIYDFLLDKHTSNQSARKDNAVE